jgi:hypothetical protein
MTTIENPDDKTKSRFWTIALWTLLILTATTTIGDILDTNDNGLAGLFLIPSMPGYIFYVIVTGDIHGWQPGPIGQVGRIAVTTIGSWIFWTPLINWIIKKRRKRNLKNADKKL